MTGCLLDWKDYLVISFLLNVLPRLSMVRIVFLRLGSFLENAKLAYSDRMKFINMPGSAHHVPLDKPNELIDLILGGVRPKLV